MSKLYRYYHTQSIIGTVAKSIYFDFSEWKVKNELCKWQGGTNPPSVLQAEWKNVNIQGRIPQGKLQAAKLLFMSVHNDLQRQQS